LRQLREHAPLAISAIAIEKIGQSVTDIDPTLVGREIPREMAFGGD
jgi:hypothetical protein